MKRGCCISNFLLSKHFRPDFEFKTMLPFDLYLQMGFDHIVSGNLKGIDHIMFLVALCAVYRTAQWRNVLVLVTAFTIGHSVTLALSTLNIVIIPSRIIKFLVPVTILLTSLGNIFLKQPEKGHARLWKNYLAALFFGFIHGMDFSNYLKALVGEFMDLLVPLFAFNLGIELGQLLIVAGIFATSFVALDLLKFKHREWNLFISGAAAGMAFLSLMENKLW